MSIPYDAIIVAGGTSHRLGGVDKAELRWRGASLLDHAISAVPDARIVVIVAPQRPVTCTRTIHWTMEAPPGGGPAAGLAAGLHVIEDEAPRPITESETVLVLAVDVPNAAAAVPLLRVAAGTHPGADAVTALSDGRRQPLLAAYRRQSLLTAFAEGSVHGISMRAILDRLVVVDLALPEEITNDIDTWGDAAKYGALPRSDVAIDGP